MLEKFKNTFSRIKFRLLTFVLCYAIKDRKTWIWFVNLCRLVCKSFVNCEFFPIVWMDKLEGYEKGLLRRGVGGYAYGPSGVNEVIEKSRICLPDVCFNLFKAARVSATSSSVILNDDLAVIERAVGSDHCKFNYATGYYILKHGPNCAAVRLGEYENIKKGIFLGGNGSFNYYHWIVEILSKSEFLSQLPECYRKYPILVSEDAISIPSFKETVELFLRDYEIVLLRKDLSYIVGKLIYINSPNSLPFNLTGDSKFDRSYAVTDPKSINYVRRIGLQSVVLHHDNPVYSRRLFLCRKNIRRSYNQGVVFKSLENLGFEKVFFEELSFSEQVRIVNNAEFIVGPTGAAWTNLIFCQEGAKALSWMPEVLGDFSVFSTIAHAVGVDLRYLTYKADVRSTADLYSKGYSIDPKQVVQGLRALGLQVGQSSSS